MCAAAEKFAQNAFATGICSDSLIQAQMGGSKTFEVSTVSSGPEKILEILSHGNHKFSPTFQLFM